MADATSATATTTAAGPLSPYAMAVDQFETAADRLGVDEGLRGILSQPKRELTVHFPVRMDGGDVQVFTGYRVQQTWRAGRGRVGSGSTLT